MRFWMLHYLSDIFFKQYFINHQPWLRLIGCQTMSTIYFPPVSPSKPQFCLKLNVKKLSTEWYAWGFEWCVTYQRCSLGNNLSITTRHTPILGETKGVWECHFVLYNVCPSPALNQQNRQDNLYKTKNTFLSLSNVSLSTTYLLDEVKNWHNHLVSSLQNSVY